MMEWWRRTTRWKSATNPYPLCREYFYHVNDNSWTVLQAGVTLHSHVVWRILIICLFGSK
jgi:hypothetical protein